MGVLCPTLGHGHGKRALRPRQAIEASAPTLESLDVSGTCLDSLRALAAASRLVSLNLTDTPAAGMPALAAGGLVWLQVRPAGRVAFKCICVSTGGNLCMWLACMQHACRSGGGGSSALPR